ncbi:MAG: aminodeoxychorismate synthase component I [Actinomycetota bacterium]|nr:aminodeoxychorismate synthase component I [Actinomycetota bacterium]
METIATEEGLSRNAKVEMEIVEIPREVEIFELFKRIAEKPYSCFLDSSLVDGRLGKTSIFGFGPIVVLETKGLAANFKQRGKSAEIRKSNPFDALRMALAFAKMKESHSELPPFLSGGIGYLSYELGRYVEKLPSSAVCDLWLPELAFCFYDKIVVEDHIKGKRYLVVTSTGGEKTRDSLREALQELGKVARKKTPIEKRQSRHKPRFASGFSREEYVEAVKKVKEYIFAGDIYQANLSQRFETDLRENPLCLYERLRKTNPAPFSAFLNFGNFQILSSSPELFLRVRGKNVETRPIKGTRPRSLDPERDLELKEELLGSEKDRAELSMIVDLERNDLGRVCEYGSVNVKEHAVIESYATVHHLVSTVEGALHESRDIVDLLMATFPGGSITGAPKIRAIEIIDELEPTERSVYTGSIGFLGFGCNHELNIAIRTMIAHGKRIYFQVGGGIVADSDPEAEYQETLDKGKALFQAISGFATK